MAAKLNKGCREKCTLKHAESLIQIFVFLFTNAHLLNRKHQFCQYLFALARYRTNNIQCNIKQCNNNAMTILKNRYFYQQCSAHLFKAIC